MKQILCSVLVMTSIFNPSLALSLEVPEGSSLPTNIEAQSIKPQLTEQEAVSLLAIESTSVPLGSKLQKRYSAYKITLTSSYPGSLQIMSGSVTNAIDGQLAYQLVKSTAAKSLFGLLVPFAWVLVTPISAGVIHHGNVKAEQEAILYPGQVPLADALHKGEVVTFSALVPAGQKPQVRLVCKDKATGLEFVKTAL